MVTDGHCSRQYESQLAHRAAAIRNLRQSLVWGIGVGQFADENELEMISGAPGRVLMIDSFEILGRIKGVSNGAYKQAISQ